MNIKNKNALLAAGGIIIIILGYLIFSRLYPSVSTENTVNKETIFNEDDNMTPIYTPRTATNETAGVAKEQSLAKLQKLSQYKNLSDFNGKEVYDLIQILEKLKLDMEFFNSAEFKNLVDYTYEVAVSEEEKGNINPFIPVKGVFAEKNINATTTSGAE